MAKPPVLSGGQREAAMAASLSFEFKKLRFKHTFYYRIITITVNSAKATIEIKLDGVTNTRRLHFTARDAKLVINCVMKALKLRVQFEALIIEGNSIIIHLKF